MPAAPTTIPALGSVYTRCQVAAMFGVTSKAVWNWSRRGAPRTPGEWVVLPSVPLGRRIWYRQVDVEWFAERMRIVAAVVAPPTSPEPTVVAARAVPADVADRLRRRGFHVGG